MSSPLLTNTKIGDLALKNRVVMAPLTRGRANPDGTANDLMKEYYTQRAGAGLIITEGVFISDAARGWVGAPGMYTNAMADSWKPVTAAVKSTDTIFFAQLWHCGRASHSSFREDQSLGLAPSAVVIEGSISHTPKGKQSYEIPKAMTEADIQQTIHEYRHAASMALEAGFHGVEIHGANGYLLDTFLQSKTNKRTDQWGGSFENRFRLLKEVVMAVAEVFPRKRIGVRLSPNGNFNDMGSPDYLESFTFYLQQLNELQVGYVHVMDGLGFGFHQLGEPYTLLEAREHFKGTLVSNCGHSIEDGERFVQEDLADLVAFGRLFISNPDLVARIEHKWPLDQRGHATTFWQSPGPEGYTDYETYRA